MKFQFIHRIQGLHLTSGNKTAGFLLALDTEALRQLRQLPVTLEENQTLLIRMRERVLRAKLMKKSLIDQCGVGFFEHSSVPLMFTTCSMFGASIGASPEELQHLAKENAVDYIGEVCRYTPHNADTADQALILLILIETWVEWALHKLDEANSPQIRTSES